MIANKQREKLVRKLQHPLRMKELYNVAVELLKDTRYQSVENFIVTLMDEGIIQEYSIKALNGRNIPVYCSVPLSDVDAYELATSLLPDGYFCNLTAIYHHSLTNQVPNTVYWCHESLVPQKSKDSGIIPDSRIRAAFIKPHRHTNFVFHHNAHEIMVIAKPRKSDYGVVEVQRQHSPCLAGTRITCLERALIDAVVSPHYNGGLSSLCDYFRAASRKLDIKRMIDIYQKLDFAYPYAQSLGFFMEHCGMQNHTEELRKVYPPQLRFYVDHGAKSTWAYDERWMLFYPKGLVNEY